MPYKTIAVELDSGQAEMRIAIAASLAMTDESHVVGVMLAPGTLQAEPILKESSQRNDFFRRAMDRPGVRSYETRTLQGDGADALSLQGCYCDLMILGQDPGLGEPVSQHIDFVEYVVLNAGCPVLTIPGQQMRIGSETGPADLERHVGSHVMIGWNASRSAGRAVRDAMPILVRAVKVHLAVINAGRMQGMHGEEPGADIALYLARQGVNVEVLQLIVDEEPGETLLSFADRLSCNLLVAGGMAHPYSRSFLMGGATRTLLQHAHLPVLMSH